MIDGSSKEAQFGYCSFVPRRKNTKLGIKKIDLCFSQKNKWDGDWLTYWFYAKIVHTSSKNSVPKFSIGCKIEAASFKTATDFLDSDGFALCCRAFELAARTLTSRDIYEEFLTTKVLPLKIGRKVGEVEMKEVDGLDHRMLVPKFGVSKPSDCIENLYVSKIERAASDMLGLYSVKEHEAMLAQFGCEIRINCVFAEMGIEVDVRGAPARKKGKATIAPKSKVPQPSLPLKTRALEVKKRKAVGSVGIHQKESRSSKKKKIIADEGLTSSSEESEEEGAKVDNAAVWGCR